MPLCNSDVTSTTAYGYSRAAEKSESKFRLALRERTALPRRVATGNKMRQLPFSNVVAHDFFVIAEVQVPVCDGRVCPNEVPAPD